MTEKKELEWLEKQEMIGIKATANCLNCGNSITTTLDVNYYLTKDVLEYLKYRDEQDKKKEIDFKNKLLKTKLELITYVNTLPESIEQECFLEMIEQLF